MYCAARTRLLGVFAASDRVKPESKKLSVRLHALANKGH
jgi:cation transport ATPase